MDRGVIGARESERKEGTAVEKQASTPAKRKWGAGEGQLEKRPDGSMRVVPLVRPERPSQYLVDAQVLGQVARLLDGHRAVDEQCAVLRETINQATFRDAQLERERRHAEEFLTSLLDHIGPGGGRTSGITYMIPRVMGSETDGLIKSARERIRVLKAEQLMRALCRSVLADRAILEYDATLTEDARADHEALIKKAMAEIAELNAAGTAIAFGLAGDGMLPAACASPERASRLAWFAKHRSKGRQGKAKSGD